MKFEFLVDTPLLNTADNVCEQVEQRLFDLIPDDDVIDSNLLNKKQVKSYTNSVESKGI